LRPALLLLTLTLSTSVIAQNSLDSLREALSAPKGIKRAEILEQLAKAERNTIPKMAWLHAQEALKIVEGIENTVFTERLFALCGSLKRAEGSYDSARLYFERAHKLALHLNDPALVADNLNAIGTTHQHQGNLTQAVQIYLEALQVAESSGSKKQTANTFNNLGFIYKIQKEYDQALLHFKKALAIREEIGDMTGVAGAYNNIGLIYMENEKYDSARGWYLKSMAILNEENNPREIAMVYNNIGITFENQGLLPEGRSYYMRSLAIKMRMNDQRGMASTYGNLGDNFLEDKNPKEAIRYAMLSRTLAAKTQSLECMITATEILALAHAESGNYKEAYEYHVEHKSLQDSLFNETKSLHITEMTTKYNVTKKEQENRSLKTAATLTESLVNKQQTIIFAVALVLGVVLLLLTFLFQLYQKSRSLASALAVQKLEVENTNAQLEDVLQEKNNVLNIMAHDLRSPMNKVIGLTQLIAFEGPVNPQQQQCLTLISNVADQGRKIIGDLLLVNREGSSTMHITTFSLTDFLQEIIQQFAPESDRKRIRVYLDVPEKNLTITSDKDSLLRLLDNLISNAIKFSPPGKSIVVKAATEEQMIRLSVSDQGPGFSTEDKKDLFKKFKRLSAQPTGGESSTGLGLAIVKQLVDQLGGKITLISEPASGATFELVLPAHKS
jgi:signal transduction histidine kinase/tetratricopeptide (TPR) repeat protein